MLALIPLAISLIPDLAQWLTGDKAAATTAAITQVVQTVAGTTDSEGVKAALQDPDKATAIKAQLATIAAQAQAESDANSQAELLARMSDVANARAMETAALAQHSLLAYGPMLVSVVILLLFGASILSTTFGIGAPLSQLQERMLEASTTLVIGFWLGNSARSPATDAALANSATPGMVTAIGRALGGKR